jgi:mono/diheme cytochrome c family protein
MIYLGAIILAVVVAAVGSASAQTPVERGSYLVNSILTCGNCHTPRGPDGMPVTEKLHAGGLPMPDEPTYTVKASNITPDRDTGIGNWSEADIKRALTQGVRPNGVPLAPIMPCAFYKVFTPGDLDAVVAYLRSVPAVRNEVQAPVYKAAVHIEPVPSADKPMTEEALRDPVKHGFYLVTIGHCMACHTPIVNDHRDYQHSLGKGGQIFRGPFGESIARNITPHKTGGIGAWSDAEIKRAITQGISRDGSRLKPPMGFAWYARMTDADLDAIVAYLRTVPPLE